MADTLIELQSNSDAAAMPHADWLGLLVDREATFRDNRRLARRLSAAKLRQSAAWSCFGRMESTLIAQEDLHAPCTLYKRVSG
jgi:hypothetical protein